MASTRIRLMSLVAVGTLALAGCTSDPVDESPAPVAPTTESSSTPDPASTTEAPADDAKTSTAAPELSAEERDQVEIEETLRLYTRALDDAFNGDASVEGIYPFSRDTAREQWVTEVMASEAQGITSSGLTELEVLEVTVSGDSAQALVCADVSDVEAVDANGESIIAEERVEQTLQDFLLERNESAERGWYIVDDTSRNEPCDG